MFSCRYSYLLVDRDFIIEKLLNNNESIYKFTQADRQVARNESEKKGFFSFNSHVEIWKVEFENSIVISMKPINFSSDL